METSRDDRSIQSRMRSRNCQFIQSSLPIVPSQSFHTSHTRRYCQDIQKSQASHSTQSRNPSQSSQRRKDRNPCHSSRPSNSSHDSQPIISVQSRKPTDSSQPFHRVFDTAQEGYSMDWIPTRRSAKWPSRVGNRWVPTGRDII